jgi:hypothetical protein
VRNQSSCRQQYQCCFFGRSFSSPVLLKLIPATRATCGRKFDAQELSPEFETRFGIRALHWVESFESSAIPKSSNLQGNKSAGTPLNMAVVD